MSLHSITRNIPAALILVCALFPGGSLAAIIGGVEFPQGEISFADGVVLYDPAYSGGAIPSPSNSEPSNALGLPEVPGNTSIGACSGDPSDCPFVSLGSGGQLVLEFVDNVLTGSDSSDLDLWIFEVGPDVEDTYVDISSNGLDWFSVGKVFGTTSGIDIDSFGFTSADTFSYLRLMDDPLEGGTGGASVGADIDAVGAITTRAVSVPEPASIFLILLGLIGFGIVSCRQRSM